MEGLERRKKKLPPQPPRPDLEEIGLVCDFLAPVAGVESFMGDPKLDEEQVVKITYFNVPKAKEGEVERLLAEYAQLARGSGKVETFWVIRDTSEVHKYRLVTRFLTAAKEGEFNGLAEVRALKEKLYPAVEALKEQKNKWAKQGFFLKQK